MRQQRRGGARLESRTHRSTVSRGHEIKLTLTYDIMCDFRSITKQALMQLLEV